MEQSSVFAKRLKEARLKAGLRQSDLAEKAGVTAASISAYESTDGTKGKNPSLEIAKLIAEALGVSLDWLSGAKTISSEENMNSNDNLATAIKIIVSLIECEAFDVDETETSVIDSAGGINVGKKIVKRARLTARNYSLSNAISCITALYKVYCDGILPVEAYKISKDSVIEKVAGYTIHNGLQHGDKQIGIYDDKDFLLLNDTDTLPL